MLLITTLDKAAPVLTLGSSEEESKKIKLYSSKFLKHLGLSCLPVIDSDGKRTGNLQADSDFCKYMLGEQRNPNSGK